jgi:UDP-GlcNAc:undecaprenyl-phosphate GlcNAc-1-phosphate transferase
MLLKLTAEPSAELGGETPASGTAKAPPRSKEPSLQRVKDSIAQRFQGKRGVLFLLVVLFGCAEAIFFFAVRASHATRPTAVMLPAFVAALVLSAIFTALTRNFAIKKSLVDQAKSVRKVHVKAVPRLGGVAFVAAWYVVIAIMLAADAHLRALVVARAPRSYTFLLGGIVIAVIGAADDIWTMRARHKLLGQVVVAFALCVSGLAVPSVELPWGHVIHLGFMSYPLTMLWVVGVMNAINLIDGLDGLAAGISEIALGAVLILSVTLSMPSLGMYAAALSGAVLGFLLYNFNPASIFMGDTGSLFLGYFLSVSLFVAGRHPSTGAVSFAVPLLILAVPVADTLLAICRRALRGKGLFSPDKEHVHHRLLGSGLSHRTTVLVLYAVCFVLAAAGLAIAFGPPSIDKIIWGALGIVILIGLRAFSVHEKISLKGLREARRRNRELRAALSSIASRLEDAKHLNDVVESLGGIVPAVSADALTASFKGHAAEHHVTVRHDSGVHMRLPIEHGREDLGFVHVVWNDREVVEPDHALALEELCDHVTRAVRRLSPILDGKPGSC